MAKISEAKHHVLVCAAPCGDCTHWELIREDADGLLHARCGTCGREFAAKDINSFAELKWEDREAV